MIKKYYTIIAILLMGVACLVLVGGCGKKGKPKIELVEGNWSLKKNGDIFSLATSSKGEWQYSVKTPDLTFRIYRPKGDAKGTWAVEKNQILFSVTESDLKNAWEKGKTTAYDVVELTENRMQLKDEQGVVELWEKNAADHAAGGHQALDRALPAPPIVVNLNKTRQTEKDKFLYLKLSYVLYDLMPGREVPTVHPKVVDATIVFFSSLSYDDVKDLASIKAQCQKLVQILNPHMEGALKEIDVENILVASTIEKVDEFLKSQSPPVKAGPEGGKPEKEGKKDQEAKEKPKKAHG